jgi:hypothetical protein
MASSILHAQVPVIYTDKSVFQVEDTSGLRPEIIVFTDSHRSMVMDAGYTKLQREVAPTLEKLTVIQHKDKPLYLPFFKMTLLRELTLQGNGSNAIEMSSDLFDLPSLRRLSVSDMLLFEHDLNLLKQRYPFIELNNVKTEKRKLYADEGEVRFLFVEKGNGNIEIKGDSLFVGSKKLNNPRTWKVIEENYTKIESYMLEDPKRSIPFLDKYLSKLFYPQVYFLEIIGDGEEVPEFCSMVAWRDLVTEVTVRNVVISQEDMDCVKTVPHIILLSDVEVAK